MEKLTDKSIRKPIKAALFDFDGTISTLRCGWETVMKPLMIEVISNGKVIPTLEDEVDKYIDESTGIQTIHQMKWLANRVKEENGASLDPWDYKAEYNRRLMETVSKRVASVKNSADKRYSYMMAGSEDFLKALTDKGVRIFVASGTDHVDVVKEVDALGLTGYFTLIAGAPEGSENCSKEAVINDLIINESLSGDDFAVFGDGKVEIALGKAAGARTVGMATDEVKLSGVNPVKRERLIKAGADVISGDFTDIAELFEFLGLEA